MSTCYRLSRFVGKGADVPCYTCGRLHTLMVLTFPPPHRRPTPHPPESCPASLPILPVGLATASHWGSSKSSSAKLPNRLHPGTLHNLGINHTDTLLSWQKSRCCYGHQSSSISNAVASAFQNPVPLRQTDQEESICFSPPAGPSPHQCWPSSTTLSPC